MGKANNNDSIRRLKSDRKQVVSQLERFNTFIRSCDQLTNQIIIKERLSKCEHLWEDFNKIQIELEYLEDTPEAISERESFEHKYFETICMFKELLNESNNSSNNLNSNNYSQGNIGSVSNAVKLPPLDLPQFDGNYENWSCFFDTFVALIHSNNNLGKVQKFYYLQSCLKGEATQAISSIQVTDLNYEIAFKILCERYENKRLIIQSHLRSLFDMPSINKTCHSELRKYLDTIQKNIRALKGLNEPVDYWDTILVFLLNLKLDLNSKKEWEMFSLKNNATSFNDFMNFLTERCQVLESVEASKTVVVKPPDKPQIKPPMLRSRAYLAGANAQCSFCNNGEHSIWNCPKFLSVSEQQRVNEVKKLRLCLNCLKPNHLSYQCTWGGCKKCSKPHHTLLHINFTRDLSKEARVEKKNDDNARDNASNNKSGSENKTHAHVTTTREAIPLDSSVSNANLSNSSENNVYKSVNTHTIDRISGGEVLLSTVRILVSDKNGKFHEVRALLDSGSQSNFITNDLVNSLGLNVNEINMSISGINNSITKSTKFVELTIQSKYCSFSANLQFFVLTKIASNLPTFTISKEALKIPSNIFLADSTFNIPGSIDILLGANVFFEILCSGQIRTEKEMPIMQKTRLGWVISGCVPRNVSNETKNATNSDQTLCNFTSNNDLQNQMEKFWIVDEVQPVKILKREENECEELFVRTTKHGSDGKFIVELPTAEGIEKIGESKEMAIRRFHKLERKLELNKEMKKEYVEFMQEYEALGHMSLVPSIEIEINDRPTYYLPHHPVIKNSSTTTKLRVVFDASARTNMGISLNDKLKSGPVIQDELFSILLRFRQHNIVLGADIAKMYRQVWIKEEQRDLQRIVWRINSDDELKHYRLNTVTYGTTPASFLAIRSLHMAANEEQNNYPRASEEIRRNFYVDDLLTGAESIDEAIKLKTQISEVLKKSGFVLRKWVSNKKEVLNQEEYDVDIKHYIVEETITKTLGIAWNIQNDSLQYTVEVPNNNFKPTKRNILSIISKVFDPLGLIGPIIVKAKILMQNLWSKKLEWDEQLPPELIEMWSQFYNDLPGLNNFNIPRHAFCNDPFIVELHGFCDSSEKAYGACIYVRSISVSGCINTYLLCAKSRVAPIKTLTIAKLELCGALLLSRLMVKTLQSLNINIKKIQYWTDAKIVLAWLQAEPATWNVFVAHRVAEVQQITNIDNWNHVIGSENPADLLSRGCSPSIMIDSNLWWKGPSWLCQENQEWTANKINLDDLENLPERRVVRQVFANLSEQDIFEKYSTFTRLQRVVAYILRFYNNTFFPQNKISEKTLSVVELDQSLFCLVRMSQIVSFSDEIHCLKSKKPIAKNSKLLELNPFLDQNEVLRVGGRLKKAEIPFSQKHPMILDKGHKLSEIIIKNEHKRNLHMGPQNLLSNIRTRFWILGGINTIKGVLKACTICFRVKPRGLNILMGELPEQRITPAKPFYNTGVDYGGPFTIKTSNLRNAKVIKAYLCLFICFVTKAVHLEVVSDLSTPSFLNALKRFIARRGRCQNIFSDCGTNFVGAKNEMSEFLTLVNNTDFNNKVAECLAHDGIKWNFIPARSPHFGGLWESHIKIAKNYLRKIIGNASLTFEELSTVFCQIEACMNSRPLSPLSNNVSDLSPLTPGHFLVGEALITLPESDVRDLKCTRLSRYQHLKFIVQTFWDRWNREYLCGLHRRDKWKYQKDSNVKVGNLVVLKDENLPPLKWAMGRIEKVYPGSDNIVRVVLVKTANGLVKRAVSKVCVLPVDE